MSELPPLREVIDAHGLRAKKSLGQNFLLDTNLTDKIARAAGDLTTHTIIEVGPGPGGLTRSLLAQGAAHVIGVEKDSRCLGALSDLQQAYPSRLTLIEADALKISESALLAEIGHEGPVKIVANLPYNIGTALLVKWLTLSEWPPFFSSLTLMFQKEVAARLTAEPGSGSYGRLSVLTQWRSDARLLFEVPREAFTPPPKVTSAIVQITPLSKPRFDADLSSLERVVAAAFGQRRKMLRQSLKSLSPAASHLLAEAGIEETRRAETLSLEEYCALARAFSAN